MKIYQLFWNGVLQKEFSDKKEMDSFIDTLILDKLDELTYKLIERKK